MGTIDRTTPFLCHALALALLAATGGRCLSASDAAEARRHPDGEHSSSGSNAEHRSGAGSARGGSLAVIAAIALRHCSSACL